MKLKTKKGFFIFTIATVLILIFTYTFIYTPTNKQSKHEAPIKTPSCSRCNRITKY